MGKLIEATHVTLGGEVGTNDWAFPYLDHQHSQYAMELLTEADAPTGPTWNATAIDGDIASFVDDLKRNAGQNLLRYGNGPLDATLMEHGLIDEFHLFLTPVAIGKDKHLFESIDTAPHLRLVDIRRLDSGVLILVYAPK